MYVLLPTELNVTIHTKQVIKIYIIGSRCSSVVDRLPGMHNAWGLISRLQSVYMHICTLHELLSKMNEVINLFVASM